MKTTETIITLLFIMCLLVITYAQLGNYLINKDYFYPDKCAIIDPSVSKEVSF